MSTGSVTIACPHCSDDVTVPITVGAPVTTADTTVRVTVPVGVDEAQLARAVADHLDFAPLAHFR